MEVATDVYPDGFRPSALEASIALLMGLGLLNPDEGDQLLALIQDERRRRRAAFTAEAGAPGRTLLPPIYIYDEFSLLEGARFRRLKNLLFRWCEDASPKLRPIYLSVGPGQLPNCSIAITVHHRTAFGIAFEGFGISDLFLKQAEAAEDFIIGQLDRSQELIVHRLRRIGHVDREPARIIVGPTEGRSTDFGG